VLFFFFFSSRRRHTRFSRDWSSDVCSSDLYFFAAIAKLYPGWMNGDFLMLRYMGVAHYVRKEIGWEPLTHFVQSREFAQIFSWLGFGFDLLIVPLLLWRKTRTIAFLSAVFFHIFNS